MKSYYTPTKMTFLCVYKTDNTKCIMLSERLIRNDSISYDLLQKLKPKDKKASLWAWW